MPSLPADNKEKEKQGLLSKLPEYRAKLWKIIWKGRACEGGGGCKINYVVRKIVRRKIVNTLFNFDLKSSRSLDNKNISEFGYLDELIINTTQDCRLCTRGVAGISFGIYSRATQPKNG